MKQNKEKEEKKKIYPRLKNSEMKKKRIKKHNPKKQGIRFTCVGSAVSEQLPHGGVIALYYAL